MNQLRPAVFLFICLLMGGMVNAQSKSKQWKTVPAPSPKAGSKVTLSDIKWDTVTWDFGTITQNVPVTKEFRFTNKAKVPISVEAANSSGSITCNYNWDPVMPGKPGSVTVFFNAASPGIFNKSITVKFSGVDDLVILTIKGKIEAAPKPPGNGQIEKQ